MSSNNPKSGQELSEEKTKRISMAYSRLFETEDGKTVLKDLMENFSVMDGTYCKDPNEMYFREGGRAVVEHIIKAIKYDPFKTQELKDEIEDENAEILRMED